MANELPVLPSTAPKHLHLCADKCGDYYVCSQRDGCPETWTCPHCEQERLDHYMSLQAEKETASGHHCEGR